MFISGRNDIFSRDILSHVQVGVANPAITPITIFTFSIMSAYISLN